MFFHSHKIIDYALAQWICFILNGQCNKTVSWKTPWELEISISYVQQASGPLTREHDYPLSFWFNNLGLKPCNVHNTLEFILNRELTSLPCLVSVLLWEIRIIQQGIYLWHVIHIKETCVLVPGSILIELNSCYKILYTLHIATWYSKLMCISFQLSRTHDPRLEHEIVYLLDW